LLKKEKLLTGTGFLVVTYYIRFSKFDIGKIEQKRSLGRPRSRWEDHISMNIREIYFEMKGFI
jgi:hypothetical protein